MPGKLGDVYDGQLYQILVSECGVLERKQNISVLLNTDGVEMFSSSKLSMWPVLLLIIIELPFSERYVIIVNNF